MGKSGAALDRQKFLGSFFQKRTASFRLPAFFAESLSTRAGISHPVRTEAPWDHTVSHGASAATSGVRYLLTVTIMP
jgi:hypothetical protein